MKNNNTYKYNDTEERTHDTEEEENERARARIAAYGLIMFSSAALNNIFVSYYMSCSVLCWIVFAWFSYHNSYL